MAHQRFVKGLFLHRGLVRCTWVMEMKTGERGRGVVRLPTSPRPCPPHQGIPLTSVQDDQSSCELLGQQQSVGKVLKPGWSPFIVTAKARQGLSLLWGPREVGWRGEGGSPMNPPA